MHTLQPACFCSPGPALTFSDTHTTVLSPGEEGGEGDDADTGDMDGDNSSYADDGNQSQVGMSQNKGVGGWVGGWVRV